MATTTGITSFNLDLLTICEEAFERAGQEMRSGYDLQTARRSINLLLLEWSSKGLNFWTFYQASFNLTPGLNTYPLPVGIIDTLDAVIRTQANQQYNQADLNINRISLSTYSTIPNKLTPGRPIQHAVGRMTGEVSATTFTLSGNINATDTTITLSNTTDLAAAGYVNIDNETIYYNYIVGNQLQNCFRAQNGTTAATHTSGTAIYVNWLPYVTVWPTPDNVQTYTFVYWGMRRMQDAGNSNYNDINPRFLPALISGLAYYIALKRSATDAIGLQKVALLKAAYDEAYAVAAEEDRERAPLSLVPRIYPITG